MKRPQIRVTHTFATLEVSERTFKEIKKKLKAENYDHSFVDENTIDMQGIGLIPSPPKPKKGDLLTWAQVKIAAKKKIPVWYVEKYHNPHDRHMNFNGVTTMKKANVGYYIGNSDINPNDFNNESFAWGDWPEGRYSIYGVKGEKYV